MSKGTVIFRRIRGRIVPIVRKADAKLTRMAESQATDAIGWAAYGVSLAGGIKTRPVGETIDGALTGYSVGFVAGAIRNERLAVKQFSGQGWSRLVRSGNKGLILGAGTGLAYGVFRGRKKR